MPPARVRVVQHPRPATRILTINTTAAAIARQLADDGFPPAMGTSVIEPCDIEDGEIRIALGVRVQVGVGYACVVIDTIDPTPPYAATLTTLCNTNVYAVIVTHLLKHVAPNHVARRNAHVPTYPRTHTQHKDRIMSRNSTSRPRPIYNAQGMRLTDCCSSLSTYVDETLCCKKCYEEVPIGQGDGNEYIGVAPSPTPQPPTRYVVKHPGAIGGD